jgi:hypothetical protein
MISVSACSGVKQPGYVLFGGGCHTLVIAVARTLTYGLGAGSVWRGNMSWDTAICDQRLNQECFCQRKRSREA